MKHISYINLPELKARLSLWKQLYSLTLFYFNHVIEYMNIATEKGNINYPLWPVKLTTTRTCVS
jgi:hypothetical protein